MFLSIMSVLFVGENVLNWIQTKDQVVFIYINRILTHPVLDAIFPIWRDAQTWYPFYLFLLIFTLINFGKTALPWILFFIITIAVCDQLSSAFLKEFFGRVRPCRNPDLANYVSLLLNRCPGHGSFPSSHAANHFGMAVFIVHTIKDHLGTKMRYAVYLWAASICYAQVYIGVHYPTDVIGGAALGWLVGYASASFYNRRVGNLTLSEYASE